MSARKTEHVTAPPRSQATEPLQPNGERYDFTSLALAGNDELERVMRCGVRPDPTRLLDWEFRGYNTFGLTDMLGFRKFKKGFYLEDPVADPERAVDGYNVQTVANGLGEEWLDRLKGGEPVRHGYFRCYPVDLSEADNRYPNALLLSYDCDRNPALDPSRRLRDYLVSPYSDDHDLLLGKAYVALWGQRRVFVSFFVLERHNEATI